VNAAAWLLSKRLKRMELRKDNPLLLNVFLSHQPNILSLT
jgi:hypothetical protein